MLMDIVQIMIIIRFCLMNLAHFYCYRLFVQISQTYQVYHNFPTLFRPSSKLSSPLLTSQQILADSPPSPPFKLF